MKKLTKNEGIAVTIAIVVVLLLFLIGSVILSPQENSSEVLVDPVSE